MPGMQKKRFVQFFVKYQDVRITLSTLLKLRKKKNELANYEMYTTKEFSTKIAL